MRKLSTKLLLSLSFIMAVSAWGLSSNAAYAATNDCPKSSVKITTLSSGCVNVSDVKNPDKFTKFEYVKSPKKVTKPASYVKLDDELKKGSDDPQLDFTASCSASEIANMADYLKFLYDNRSVDLQNQVLRAKYSQTDGMRSYPKDIEKTYIKLVQDRYLAKVKEQAKDNTKKQQDQVAAFAKDVDAALAKRHTERYNAANTLYSEWVQLATEYFTVANNASDQIYTLRSTELNNYKAACATGDNAKIKAAYLTFNQAGKAQAKAMDQKFTEYYAKKTGKIASSYTLNLKKIEQSETTYQKKLCDLRGAVKGSDGKVTKASEKYCKKNQKGKYTAVLAAVAKKAAPPSSGTSNPTGTTCSEQDRKDPNNDNCYQTPECSKNKILNPVTKECESKHDCEAGEVFNFTTKECESKDNCKKTANFSASCFEGKYVFEKPCIYSSGFSGNAGQLTKYAVDTNGNKRKIGASGITNVGACPAKSNDSSGSGSSESGSGSSSTTCGPGKIPNGSGGCKPEQVSTTQTCAQNPNQSKCCSTYQYWNGSKCAYDSPPIIRHWCTPYSGSPYYMIYHTQYRYPSGKVLDSPDIGPIDKRKDSRC